MRLHHLEVTAFGPFAETVAVDFDALSSAGLFLLSGRTGAGKTSVLDAVCFALYGDVPGDRSSAKRFRCDTAAPGVAPRVVLEATLAGRRFRLTRSPAWQRPKKRGAGHTTEQAHVLLEERAGHGWRALSTRMDEAGQLVTELVGMTMPQFCQVAMLPQGRFQTFLRARSEERHRLLSQLFSTRRFEDMERWLREHARELHRRSQRHEQDVAAVVARLHEATGSGAGTPDEPEVDLAATARTGELAAWSRDLVGHATAAAEEAAVRLAAATTVADAARRERDAGHRLDEQQQRHAAALAERSALDEVAADHEDRRDRLTRARRAAPVVPLHRLAVSSAQQRDRAGEAALSAAVAAAALLDLPEPTSDDLAAAEASARDTVAAARALLPREAELAGLADRISADENAEVHLVAEDERLAARVVALPAEVTDLTERLTAARDAAGRLQDLARLVGEHADRLAAHDRAGQLRVRLESARAELSTAVDASQSRKEEWLEVREARLHGMAAEIALDLAVGACCPVCGSEDHPQKAVPTEGAPTADTEKDARRAGDVAEGERPAREALGRDLAAGLGVAESEAGPDPADAVREALARLRDEREALRPAAESRDELAVRLERTESALVDARDDLTAVRVELAALRSRLEASRADAARTRAELDALLLPGGHPTLGDLLTDSRSVLETVGAAISTAERHDTARLAAADSARERDAWLAAADFADLDAALAAVLPADRQQALEDEVASYDARRAAVEAVLADPALVEAAKRPEPDPGALDAALVEAADALTAARTAQDVAATRATRVTTLDGELSAELSSWRPVREAHAVAAELASFVEGKSADNELRMRLSAYVLAWRLGQVVAAANHRLLRMSDQRYTLEHTGRRGAGESRGGLSLLVRDEWSGEARDPATLSGGETFVVSLALALGLADVVTAEAGGADLDTLFVDEGFGALDADTLDDVMGTLDSLRDGGRVVGVVSHVAELRSRIPTQLVVTKQRGGSTVAVGRPSA